MVQCAGGGCCIKLSTVETVSGVVIVVVVAVLLRNGSILQTGNELIYCS